MGPSFQNHLGPTSGGGQKRELYLTHTPSSHTQKQNQPENWLTGEADHHHDHPPLESSSVRKCEKRAETQSNKTGVLRCAAANSTCLSCRCAADWLNRRDVDIFFEPKHRHQIWELVDTKGRRKGAGISAR